MLYRIERKFLLVSGPDAVNFLNNLLTHDVSRLNAALVLYAALLTPQGKIIADMLLWHSDHGILIELDPSRANDVQRRLSMYKLRADVSIEDVTDNHLALWAPPPSSLLGGLPDPRAPDGSLGWIATAKGDAYANRESGSASYNAARIALGVPDLARDAAPEEVFALEALLEELNGVDFQKGCFVGQENVSRMKRRATTRKKFCPVVFDGEPPPYGTPIRVGEAELGSIRSGVAGRAISLLRLDRALEAMDKGHQLTAGEKSVRLDPPAWLLLPARDD